LAKLLYGDRRGYPEFSGGQSFEPSGESRPIFLLHGYELHAHALFGTTSLDGGTSANFPRWHIQQQLK
jgi:hypothetical protein